MIITENTRWITTYELLDEHDVRMVVTQFKNKKPAKEYRFVIPIEFYDDVRIWDWEVVPQHSHTPVITTKQHRMIKELTGIKKGGMLSLNMVSPFMAIFKHKTMVSSKSDKQWKDNDGNCLWYNAGYEDTSDEMKEQLKQAFRSFDIYVERALQQK